MTKHVLINTLLWLSLAATGWSQSPPVPLKAAIYSNITSASRLDGCYSGYPCIDNRSSSTRRNNYHAFRVFGTGTWSVTMKWADTNPTGFVSYGSTAVVTNASPSSAIGYGLDPASITRGWHDYIIFEITGTATIQNYFGTQSAWWSPSVAGIALPIPANQGGTGTQYQTIVYPEVYGAIPGNVTDSGAAFNLALAAAGALPNGAVWCQGSFNMGTTNLLIDTANGASIFSPSPSGCRLNWTSGATGYALTIGTTGQTTYLSRIDGVRIITASTTQDMVKLIRANQVKLWNMELEGPNNTTDSNDCITIDGLASDSLFTDVMNVNCNHVKRGLVVLSTGSGNNVTTWNSVSFKVNGQGPQAASVAGTVGVDFGASGNGDGFNFYGGNMENLEKGFTSSGGAGSSMHGVLIDGVRFENVTYGIDIEQFAFDVKAISNGALLTFSGAGRCSNGNVMLANSSALSTAPHVNCLTSTLNINPGLANTNRPQTAINMTIPTASSFPIERNGLDTSNRVVYMKNASGMPSIIGEISTLWTPINGAPATVLGPKVSSGTFTSLSAAASGTVTTSGTAVAWVSGTPFSTAWTSGHPITINAVVYYVSSVTNTTNLVLTGTAGAQVGVAYSANIGVASGTVSTVNASATASTVTKVTGNDFSTTDGAWAGATIVIAGVPYVISSVTSTTVMTVTGQTGTQTGVAWSVSPATTGASGSLCFMQWTTGGLKGLAYVGLTSTNTIAATTALSIVDGGYGFTGTAPTYAKFLKSNDMYPSPTASAAACFEPLPGSVTVATTLGNVGGHLVTNSSGTQGNTLYVGEGTDYNLVPTKNPSLSEITVGTLRGALYNPSNNQTLWPATGNNNLLWINTDGAAATGSWCFQPGNFSAGQGGGMCMYQQAHASKPGFVSVNMGSSVGKFQINNAGTGNGTAVHSWDVSGFSTSTGVAFASLGTPAVGTTIWCTDCTIATPCSGAGSGAWAFRVAGATWKCPF